MGSICGYNHSGSTFVNCYYLITGTEKGNYGVGMTQQQFASGEVCYALNAGNGGSVVWKQTCGTGLPGFGGKTVYRAQTYKNDGSTVFAYTNDSNKKVVTYTAPAPYTSPAYASSGESTGDNSDGHTHVYKEPEWNWKKYESAKATLTCQDCGEEFILKASVKKEVTEPTCTEDGETVYKATVEKDGITFKDKRVVEKERTGHDDPLTKMNGNSDPNAEQTCAGPIYTETFYMCTACKKCFKDEKGKHELTTADSGFKPALKQHTYDLSKQPAWDHPSTENIATAIFSCTKCTAKTAVAATVKSKITQDATCVEDGKRTYTSNVRFKGTTYPGPTWEEKIPAIGHNFKLDPKTLEYKCSRCKVIEPVGNNPAPPSTTKDIPDSAPKDETLTIDETLPGDEDPSLPPGAEETQETPTPSEEQDCSDEADTPDTPDGSGGVDAPGEPEASDGQDTPDNPDTSGGTDISDAPGEPGNSDGQETPNTPDKSDASGSADIPNAPGESDTSDGADIPPVSDEPGTAENAEPYGLLCPEEEGALTGTTVSLHSNAAVKSVAQPAGEQQELFLWGSAIVLMLLVGITLLIILQKKQN